MVRSKVCGGNAPRIAFGITVFVLTILLLVGVASALSNDGGGSWQYSKDITISNSGSALADYQILVSLDSSNFPTNAQINGADIRFTDAVGNELNYWIESWDNAGKIAKIWVKVPSISAGTTSTTRMYYGNPSASSSSNGDTTFDFFDDFSGSLDKWVVGPTGATIENGAMKLSTLISADVTPIYTKAVISLSDYIVDVNAKAISGHYRIQVYQRYLPSNNNLARFWGTSGGINYQEYINGWGTNYLFSPTNIVDGEWNKIKVEVIGDNNILSANGLYVGSHSLSTPSLIDGTQNRIGFGEWYTTVYYDDVRVRKYASPEPTVSVGNGLVAEYHFDGNAQDTSGNGNHGTLINGASFGNGISGQALNLDGVDDYVSVGAIPGLTSTNTKTMWIKPGRVAGGLNMYMFQFLSAQWIQLYDVDGDGNLETRAGGLNNIPGTYFVNGNFEYAIPNEWYFVAVSIDSNNLMKIYVNGILDASGIITSVENPSSFNIGRHWDNFGCKVGCDYFNGLIDEVRVFNRALTDEEIKAEYEKYAPPILPSITISPSSASLAVGSTQEFTATDQNGNPVNAVWSSSDTSVGTIDQSGVFTALKAGMTTVKAASEGAEGSASVIVFNLSVLSPPSEYLHDDTYIWVKLDHTSSQPEDFPVQILYDGKDLKFDSLEKTVHIEPYQNSGVVEFRVETPTLSMLAEDHFDVYTPGLGLGDPVQLRLMGLNKKLSDYFKQRIGYTKLNENIIKGTSNPDTEIINFAGEVLNDYNLNINSADELKAMALLHYIYKHGEYKERNPSNLDPHELIHEIESTGGRLLGHFHGVCKDYTTLYNSLAIAVGLQVRPVYGYFERGGDGHSWSEVNIDGKWILIDSTNGIYKDSILSACNWDYSECSPNTWMKLWGDDKHTIKGLPNNIKFSYGGFWPSDDHKKVYEHYPEFGGILFAGTTEIDPTKRKTNNIDVTSDYSYDILPPANSLVVGGFSPIEISIYDSKGTLITKAEDNYMSWSDINGNVVKDELPTGKIAVATDINPSEDYSVKIAGTGAGTADIKTMFETKYRTVYIDYNDISVSSDFKAVFYPIIGDYNLKIDYNGDGIIDEIKEPTNVEIQKVEVIPPTTTMALSGTAGDNGWNTSDVQVTLTATDEGGSGVANTQYNLNGAGWITYTGTFTISDEGTTTIEYNSTDNAGNIEPTKTQIVKIDKTLSQITINTPVEGSEYLLNQPLTADWSASDAVSDIASATGTYPSGNAINTASVGTKTFSVDATDNAGNTNTKKVTYYIRYKCSGILQPINADGSSIFKLGNTIPVKFQLWDAGGNFITNAVAKIYVAKISDGIIGTEMEANSTSNATTGNLFRYDSTSNQYIFNLGTKTLSTGTWQIRIELDDGTSKTVTIGLK